MTEETKRGPTEVSEAAATTTLRVIAAALLLFGLLQSYGSYRDIARSRAAEAWPSVGGAVTLSMRGRQRTSLTRFAYEYQAAGDRYESSRVGFAYRPFYRAVLEYSAGDSLTVRYDPADPGTAVIKWGVSAFTLLGELVAPLVFFVIGGYLLRLSFRE